MCSHIFVIKWSEKNKNWNTLCVENTYQVFYGFPSNCWYKSVAIQLYKRQCDNNNVTLELIECHLGFWLFEIASAHLRTDNNNEEMKTKWKRLEEDENIVSMMWYCPPMILTSIEAISQKIYHPYCDVGYGDNFIWLICCTSIMSIWLKWNL